MVKQELTFHKDYQIASYKEYHNGVLVIHTKYNENNKKVYIYLAYADFLWEAEVLN